MMYGLDPYESDTRGLVELAVQDTYDLQSADFLFVLMEDRRCLFGMAS